MIAPKTASEALPVGVGSTQVSVEADSTDTEPQLRLYWKAAAGLEKNWLKLPCGLYCKQH